MISTEMPTIGAEALYKTKTKLIVVVWHEGVIPEEWKQGDIEPVYERGRRWNVQLSGHRIIICSP